MVDRFPLDVIGKITLKGRQNCDQLTIDFNNDELNPDKETFKGTEVLFSIKQNKKKKKSRRTKVVTLFLIEEKKNFY